MTLSRRWCRRLKLSLVGLIISLTVLEYIAQLLSWPVNQMSQKADNIFQIPRPNESPITEVSIENFDQQHDVNCKGVLLCLKEVLKVMLAQDEVFVEGRSGRRSIGRGAIANVISLSALVGHPNSVTYTSSTFVANGVSKTAGEILTKTKCARPNSAKYT